MIFIIYAKQKNINQVKYALNEAFLLRLEIDDPTLHDIYIMKTLPYILEKVPLAKDIDTLPVPENNSATDFKQNVIQLARQASQADRIWVIEQIDEHWLISNAAGDQLPVYLGEDETEKWLFQLLLKAWNKQTVQMGPNGLDSQQEYLPYAFQCCPIVLEGETIALIYMEWYEGRDKPVMIQPGLGGFSAAIKMLFQQAKRIDALESELEDQQNILSQARRQLSACENLASLGLITTSITHEINNSVNFISSAVGPLKRGIEDLREMGKSPAENDIQIAEQYQEIDELLETLAEGAHRSTDIIKGVGAVSKTNGMKYQWSNLHNGILDTLRLLHPLVQDGIEVETKFQELPEIYCQPGKINQVFMNILSNAFHALEGEGKISIKTGLEYVDTVEMAYIRIKDNGIGIPREKTCEIFKPFYTDKKENIGTGLGLAISLDIIKSHQGTIEVESEVGVGSVFTIKIPIGDMTENKRSI